MKHITLKLGSTLAGVALATTLLASGGPAPQESGDLKRTGVITAWMVAADGTVTFRLQGSGDDVAGKPGESPKQAKEVAAKDAAARSVTWFATPPNQSAAVQLEELVLQVVLAGSTGSAPITVTAKLDPGNKGDTMEKPLFLKTIGRL
jgi:hypothetical protein